MLLCGCGETNRTILLLPPPPPHLSRLSSCTLPVVIGVRASWWVSLPGRALLLSGLFQTAPQWSKNRDHFACCMSHCGHGMHVCFIFFDLTFHHHIQAWMCLSLLYTQYNIQPILVLVVISFSNRKNINVIISNRRILPVNLSFYFCFQYHHHFIDNIFFYIFLLKENNNLNSCKSSLNINIT